MKGMVVCPQPMAAEVGVQVLRHGGNAVDAAVSAAFVQGIVDPMNCGIGGFGQMHVYMAKTGEEKVIDFHGKAGAKVRADMWEDIILDQPRDRWGYVLKGQVNALGYASVTVPGTVMGLHEGSSRFGTLPWRELLAPAIKVASQGYPVSPDDAASWRVDSTTFAPLLVTSEARRIYTKNGTPCDGGDLIVNRNYAETLRQIASNGPEVFYRGSIATMIADDMERNGGFVTLRDLWDYRVRVYSPLSTDYRGYTVASNDAPGGGITLLELLNILEGYDLSKYDWRGLGSDIAEYIHTLAMAMRACESDRTEFVGDPEHVDVPTGKLVSKERAAEWRERISSGEKVVVRRWTPKEPASTTHLSAVDAQGNAVSLTHTLGSCSGVITPGLGFLYNNAMINFDPVPGMPNSIAPGKSRNTQMSPTMALRDGRPRIVVGAPGGSRIVGAVAETIINIIDHGMTPFEAVAHPRISCLDTDVVDLSSRIPAYICEEVEARGDTVVRGPASYDSFGRPQAILIEPERDLVLGGSDPRGKGTFFST